MKCLKITCPESVTDKGLRKLENYYGIEFLRDSSNGGALGDYNALIGDEELLSEMRFHNLIKPMVVKNAQPTSIIDGMNFTKNVNGGAVDLAGADGSDIMVGATGTIYAILGGTNPTYERYIFSDEPFTYDGDVAKKYTPRAVSPDYGVLINGVLRSVYSKSYIGTMNVSNRASFNKYQNGAGFPTTSISRYGYEAAARNRNEDIRSYIPYAPTNAFDKELIQGLLYVEARTKYLNKVFGNGITANIAPTAANWGTVSGVKIMEANGTAHYYTFGAANVIYQGGTQVNVNMWTVINNSCPLLEVMEVQRAVSADSSKLTSLTAPDGTSIQGKGQGVMTGIVKMTVTGTINCAFSSGASDSACSVEIVLQCPVWRGISMLFGHLLQWVSGYEGTAINKDGVVYENLYRAPSIEAMTTDTDEALKDSEAGFGFTSVYRKVASDQTVSGLTTTKPSVDGVSVAFGVDRAADAGLYNYQGSWLSIADITRCVEKNKYYRCGTRFGGFASSGPGSFGYCAAHSAGSSAGSSSGSGLSVKLNA